jgi:hypothetical protein
VLELCATARTGLDRAERRIAADDADDEPARLDIDSGPHDPGDARAEPDADADRAQRTDACDADVNAASERTRCDTDDDATGPCTQARDPGTA